MPYALRLGNIPIQYGFAPSVFGVANGLLANPTHVVREQVHDSIGGTHLGAGL